MFVEAWIFCVLFLMNPYHFISKAQRSTNLLQSDALTPSCGSEQDGHRRKQDSYLLEHSMLQFSFNFFTDLYRSTFLNFQYWYLRFSISQSDTEKKCWIYLNWKKKKTLQSYLLTLHQYTNSFTNSVKHVKMTQL